MVSKVNFCDGLDTNVSMLYIALKLQTYSVMLSTHSGLLDCAENDVRLVEFPKESLIRNRLGRFCKKPRRGRSMHLRSERNRRN